jgi:hypothetical protein
MRSITRRELGIGAAMWLTRGQAEVKPGVVRVRDELEPLVRRLEETPREKCAAMVAEGLRGGVSYRQWLAALFLAGVRNVNPQPPGFAMHCVFVIHSAHLIGMEAPADVRMLPLFHALDHFKASQERDAKQTGGDWTMRELSGAAGATDAAFHKAMDAWDVEQAERQAAGLAERGRIREVFGTLWRYGARDYRNIGHKAIYTANAERTLNAIGWEHAAPVLRSLVRGLLDFGEERKVNGYAFEDQCFLNNERRIREGFARLPDAWASAQAGREAALRTVAAIRKGTPEEACAAVMAELMKGTSCAASVWDGIHLAAVELMARSGGTLVPIHAVTSANGLHHAWLAAADARVRCLALLQAVGWMTQFRVYAGERDGKLRDISIAEIRGKQGAIEEIYAVRKEQPDEAMSRALGLSGTAEGRRAWMASVMRHTAALADEVHLYKYLAAIAEDMRLVSEEWRPCLAASLVYYSRGPGDREPAAMKRAREALSI